MLSRTGILLSCMVYPCCYGPTWKVPYCNKVVTKWCKHKPVLFRQKQQHMNSDIDLCILIYRCYILTLPGDICSKTTSYSLYQTRSSRQPQATSTSQGKKTHSGIWSNLIKYCRNYMVLQWRQGFLACGIQHFQSQLTFCMIIDLWIQIFCWSTQILTFETSAWVPGGCFQKLHQMIKKTPPQVHLFF